MTYSTKATIARILRYIGHKWIRDFFLQGQYFYTIRISAVSGCRENENNCHNSRVQHYPLWLFGPAQCTGRVDRISNVATRLQQYIFKFRVFDDRHPTLILAVTRVNNAVAPTHHARSKRGDIRRVRNNDGRDRRG